MKNHLVPSKDKIASSILSIRIAESIVLAMKKNHIPFKNVVFLSYFEREKVKMLTVVSEILHCGGFFSSSRTIRNRGNTIENTKKV